MQGGTPVVACSKAVRKTRGYGAHGALAPLTKLPSSVRSIDHFVPLGRSLQDPGPPIQARSLAALALDGGDFSP